MNELMIKLNFINAVPTASRDRRVTFRAKIAQIRVEYIVFKDKFSIVQALKSVTLEAFIKIPRGNPGQLAKPFFPDLQEIYR